MVATVAARRTVVSRTSSSSSSSTTSASSSSTTPPKARAAGAAMTVTNLDEMHAFRAAVDEAKAKGLPVPQLHLLPDPTLPKRVQEVVEALDKLLPQMMTDKGLTLEKLFGADREYARGESTPWHKTVAGANALAAAALAAEIGAKVTGIGDVLTIAAVAHATWKAIGATIYPVHWALDNYDVFGVRSFEFQVHHDQPGELTKWQPSMTMYDVGKNALPLLVASVLLNPGVAAGTAALTFIGGAILGTQAHKWEHGKAPKLVQWLQDAGILASKSTHHRHHSGDKSGLLEGEKAPAHVGSYDILSGDLLGDVNGLFDGLELARRAERAVWQLTGVEPNAWKEYPELKEIWTAPPAEREAKKREVRIAAYEKNIAAHEAKLAWAKGADGDVARAVTAAYPAKIEKMKAQLEVLKDPSRADGLLRDVEQAKAALASISFSPSGIRLRHTIGEDKYRARVADAEARLKTAEAALRDAAPFLAA